MALPVFKAWTVDVRLKEFRRVDAKKGLIFLSFKCKQGDELLADYIDQLDLDKQEDKDRLREISS